MSADDQTFLDTLSSVPNDVRKYSMEVADYVDKHLEHVSNTLRQALSSSEWIPESARPRPPSPPPRALVDVSPTSAYAQIYDWVMRNKILTTVIVVVAGSATYHIVRRKTGRKKRRAKRASNGARLEVVVIAGQPSEPMTRSVSLDLERRGFIVYVVCNTIEEEVQVQNESRPDIKPLMIDIVDTESARQSVDRFTALLQTPHTAFSGAKPHHLALRSLILLPSPTYPSSPIATLAPSTYWDLLHTRLLTPMITLQTFLPLLHSAPLQHPTHHLTTPPPKPTVVVLTPSIISSLSPAFHLPESTICAALTAFTSVLTSELSPLGIPVTHLQLGTFDLTPIAPHAYTRSHLSLQAQRAETLRWDEDIRQAYAGNYVRATAGTWEGGQRKGSTLRGLNDAVFDAMFSRKGGVVRVGMGAWTYAMVGAWVPRGVVGWMMGMRRSRGMVEEKGERGLVVRSRGTSPEGAGGARGLGMDGSEYVSVYGEGVSFGENLERDGN